MKYVISYGLFFYFVIMTPFALRGQLQASHWYFGENAGIIFDGPVPSVTRGSLHTIEGCSSISTCSGELLFYTDGTVVYDSRHQLMPNGTNLAGNSSSSQSGLIVPHPADENLYYIFTVDDYMGFNGLRYSLVDMRLNNGYGDVVASEKNIPLVSNVREKVTAIYSADIDAVWVLTMGGAPLNGNQIPISTQSGGLTTFYAVKIDSTGIHPTAVISPARRVMDMPHGYMKFSLQGDKIAVAGYYSRQLYLYDFDVQTGEVSRPRNLPKPANFAPYGLEFSPSGRFLFVQGTDEGGTMDHAYISLFQYDLEDPALSYTDLLPVSAEGYRSALQIGLDGKIYMAESVSYDEGAPFLSVIHNPEAWGEAARMQRNFLVLENGTVSRQGLPQFIQSYFLTIHTTDPETAEQRTTFCVNHSIRISVSSNKAIDYAEIDFGDGQTATVDPGTSATNIEILHTYTQAGSYTVRAVVYYRDGCEVELYQSIEIYNSPQAPELEIFACDPDDDGIAEFDLTELNAQILAFQEYFFHQYEVNFYHSSSYAEFDTLALTEEIYVNDRPLTDTLWYAVENQTVGCRQTGHIVLHATPLPEIFDIPPVEVCSSDPAGTVQLNLTEFIPQLLNGRDTARYEIEFYLSLDDALQQQNPVELPENFQITGSDEFIVYYNITDAVSGCWNTGEIIIRIAEYPQISMDTVFYLCPQQTLEIDAPPGYHSYLWSTGDTTRTVRISEPGTYQLEVRNENNCPGQIDIQVIPSAPAQIDTIYVYDFRSPDNAIEIIASGPGEYEYSLDDVTYQSENMFDGLLADIYTVYVNDRHGCGKVTDTVAVLDAPKYFSPNADGQNDHWHIYNIKAYPETKIYIYDRFGRLMASFNADHPGWDGLWNGRALPPDDYWFVAEIMYGNGRKRVVKGHFSLIR